MENKHTPGPWHLSAGTYSQRWVVDSKSPPTGKQNLIAMLQSHWEGNKNDTMDANANLIAAAPQMLEALEELVELKDRRHSLPVEIYQESREKAWNKCRAAIAAVKGEI